MIVLIIHQTTANVTSICARLGEQHPALGRLEQTGEGIAEAPAVLAHRVVGGVARLVTRGRPGKARHGLHLRTEEGGRALWQHIAAGLTLHDTRHGLTAAHALRIDLIAIGHVAAGHTEDHIERLASVLLETADSLCCHHLHMALLRGLQAILILILAHLARLQCQALGQVVEVHLQSQGRGLDEHLAVEFHLILRTAVGDRHRHNHLPVRAGNLLL